MNRHLSKIAFLVFLLNASDTFAEYAIVGGIDYLGPVYGATITLDAVASPLTGDPLPSSAQYIALAMNSSGSAIFGGQENSGVFPMFAYIISPSGTAQKLTGAEFLLNGGIRSVAINNDNIALIGGSSGVAAYAVFVSPGGAIIPFSGGDPLPASGRVFGVAINDSGNGLIGGNITGGGAYGARVSSSGIVANLTGVPLPGALNSYISSTSINSSGAGLIGGGNLTSMTAAYAAIVTPAGEVTPVTGDPLPLMGVIVDVGINDSGAGVIGGYFTGGGGYAAIVSPSGSVTNLTGSNLPPVSGSIESVAINESGVAIIGGWDSVNPAYASFVSPTGETAPLTGDPLPASGAIYDVAINDAGVAIVAGEDYSGTNPAFAALISPSGQVTKITGATLPVTGVLLRAGISNILNAVTPTFVGSYSNSTGTLLAASYAIKDHAMIHHKHFWIDRLEDRDEVAYIASNESWKHGWGKGKGKNEGSSSKIEYCYDQPRFYLWMEPFFDYSSQEKEGGLPALTNEITGIVSGVDYLQSERVVIGGGLGYAFNYTHYSRHLGHAKTNQEIGFFYSSFQWDWAFLNATLLGGYYQLKNERHSAGLTTSKAKTDGWLISPHVEVCAAPYFNPKWSHFLIESFAMVDWVNNWQKHYTETGSSGFNLVVKDLYSSLLRSEVGLRFYEILQYEWGNVFIEEKASFINKAPFHANPISVFFVGSISSFSVDTGVNTVQNLGGVQFQTTFVPFADKCPYASLGFEGEFGSSYQSYFVEIEIGMNF